MQNPSVWTIIQDTTLHRFRAACPPAAIQEGIFIRKKGKFEASRAPRKASAPREQGSGKRRRGVSAGGKVAIILGALILVAAIAVCAYGFVLMGGSAVYPNVYIAGIPVGGLNREAALAAVRDEVSSRFTADTLTIVLPDQTVTIDSDASNLRPQPRPDQRHPHLPPRKDGAVRCEPDLQPGS